MLGVEFAKAVFPRVVGLGVARSPQQQVLVLFLFVSGSKASWTLLGCIFFLQLVPPCLCFLKQPKGKPFRHFGIHILEKERPCWHQMGMPHETASFVFFIYQSAILGWSPLCV